MSTMLTVIKNSPLLGTEDHLRIGWSLCSLAQVGTAVWNQTYHLDLQCEGGRCRTPLVSCFWMNILSISAVCHVRVASKRGAWVHLCVKCALGAHLSPWHPSSLPGWVINVPLITHPKQLGTPHHSTETTQAECQSALLFISSTLFHCRSFDQCSVCACVWTIFRDDELIRCMN